MPLVRSTALMCCMLYRYCIPEITAGNIMKFGLVGRTAACLVVCFGTVAGAGAALADGAYHHMPTGITADSKLIIFQSWERQQSGKNVSQLFSIKADGTGLKRALQLGVNEGWPSFTKDGKRAVLFSRLELGGRAELFLLDLAEANNLGEFSTITRLTFGEDSDFFPSWSPDESQIVFYGHRSGEAQIYVMDADGSNVRDLSKPRKKSWFIYQYVNIEVYNKF
ncbi:MAG: hypothetical protein COB37_09120 [Kordiimonadales bacterium]|nr:MAG: hypothetical protein COB37_09120 [Kordiimonadales bacterium]